MLRAAATRRPGDRERREEEHRRQTARRVAHPWILGPATGMCQGLPVGSGVVRSIGSSRRVHSTTPSESGSPVNEQRRDSKQQREHEPARGDAKPISGGVPTTDAGRRLRVLCREGERNRPLCAPSLGERRPACGPKRLRRQNEASADRNIRSKRQYGQDDGRHDEKETGDAQKSARRHVDTLVLRKATCGKEFRTGKLGE
jgi:hypothetical protein